MRNIDGMMTQSMDEQDAEHGFKARESGITWIRRGLGDKGNESSDSSASVTPES